MHIFYLVARLCRVVAPKGKQGNRTSRNASDPDPTVLQPLSLPLHLSPPLATLSSLPPSMPTCRRKRVLLIDTPPTLLQSLKSDPNKHVYYLTKTGEIFDSYEQASIPSLSHPQS